MLAYSRDNSPQRDPRESCSNQPISTPNAEQIIGLAEEVIAKPSIPSTAEIAGYQQRSQMLGSASSVVTNEIVELVRMALELKERLEGTGQWSSKGGISSLQVREEWARLNHKTITALTKEAQILYVESPTAVLKAIAEDFVSRLTDRGVALTGSFSASAISAALEQTRLMVVFAGGALKSEEHAQTAISGIRERSFTVPPDGEKPAGERSAGDRQTEFEKRQAAKAAASAAKRAALKAGGALPIAGAPQKPALDTEKNELLVRTAAQHRAQAQSCRPTELQRKILRQRDPKDLERIFAAQRTARAGVSWAEDSEKIRIEMVNNFANRMKDWLGLEVQLGATGGVQRLTTEQLPLVESSAFTRHQSLAGELSQLTALQELINKDLSTLGRAVLQGPEHLQRHFSAAELKVFREIIDPPRPLQGYELAE